MILKNLVVDPVMVAKSGDLLLRADAIQALRSRLIPLAKIVTPNLPEAEELTEMKLTRVKEIEEAARRIIAMGAESVVIKGGHRKGPAIDLFFDGKKIRTLRSPAYALATPMARAALSPLPLPPILPKGKRSRMPSS